MLEVLKSLATNGGLWAGVGTVVIAYVLKKIPNEKLYAFVRAAGWKAGVVVTLGMSRWKWSAPFWEKHIEPWFVDAIRNTVLALVDGFVGGITSDTTTI